ncbi:hypothetical protein D3C86_1984620 [compost metagenome]
MTRDFFEIHLDWLQSNIALGQAAGEIKAELDGVKIARVILNTLEGGSFVAWALNDKYDRSSGFDFILDGLRVAEPRH